VCCSVLQCVAVEYLTKRPRRASLCDRDLLLPCSFVETLGCNNGIGGFLLLLRCYTIRDLRVVLFICKLWLIHMCAMTHSYVCHDLFICVPWLIHMCAMTHSCMCHDSFMYVPCLSHMCATMQSYVCHDSFICVSWLIWKGLHVQMLWVALHVSFICEPWHIHLGVAVFYLFFDPRVTTLQIKAMSSLWHGFLICVSWLTHMCAMTHSDVCHDSLMCAMTH